MSTEVKTPIDIVGLREEFSKLTYDKLKEKAEELGVISVWKNGVNKQTAVENILKAYVEKTAVETPSVDETPVETTQESGIFPEGEWDIDEDTLVEYPELVEKGFSVGDILVVEAGKPWFKKDLGEEITRTEGIVSTLTPEEAGKIIKEANGGLGFSEDVVISQENLGDSTVENPENSVEVVEEEVVSEEYVPEIIDETLYSEEDLVENIEICQANTYQALPETRIKLLRKIEALSLALERKRK